MPQQTTPISIIEYTSNYADDLLRLLLLLQKTYFSENALPQYQELREEKHIEQSYKDYVREVQECTDDSWKILLAVAGDKIIGFIMGSVETDDSLVKGTVGKVEDWYVENEYRGTGTGRQLYTLLEQWFTAKGCDQVISDTWQGNDLSINAHLRSGFFVSGVSFSKKLG